MTALEINISPTEHGFNGTIIGPLNRNTVAQLEKSSQQSIITCPQITINLSQVSHVDTAGLAWLLYLMELAAKTNCQISFVHLPLDLLKLAKLSAVDAFFK